MNEIEITIISIGVCMAIILSLIWLVERKQMNDMEVDKK